jgi:hypothetical protein
MSKKSIWPLKLLTLIIKTLKKIKEDTNRKGVICIDAVDYEAIGYQDHSRVSNPTFDPFNPVQVLRWASQ